MISATESTRSVPAPFIASACKIVGVTSPYLQFSANEAALASGSPHFSAISGTHSIPVVP